MGVYCPWRRIPIWIALAVVLVSVAPGIASAGPFKVETLADGVYAFVPETGDRERTNSVVIDTPEGLLVVDAQPSARSARELLEAIKAHASAEVRYLVYTHPHADSVGGASAFPSRVTRIASSRAMESLADETYDFAGETRARAEANEASEKWKEPQRLLPTLVLVGQTVIPRPEGDVLIYPLSPAHSKGDLMVGVADAGILVVGDIASAESNWYGLDANVGAWISALNSIARMPVDTVVPLRGRVMNLRDVRAQRNAFAWLRNEVVTAFAASVPAEEIPDHVMASESVSDYFDIDARPQFLPDLARQVVAEAMVHRRKRGLEP